MSFRTFTPSRGRVGFWSLAASLIAWASTAASLLAAPFFVDYSAKPNPSALMAYPVCVLSPNAKLDIAALPKQRPELYAYVSVVEVAASATYRKQVEALKIPVAATNREWDSLVMDITHPAWTQFVVQELAGEAVKKGFDGFFLDTVDSFNRILEQQPQRAAEVRAGMVSLVKALKTAYPAKKIMLNRGFEIWEELKGSFDSMMIESVFRSWKPGTREFLPAKAEDTAYLMAHINKLKAANIPVFILDYVGPGMLKEAKEAAEKIEKAGCHALVTTPELEGCALAPLHRVPRRVLVLFGEEPAASETPLVWPADAQAASTLQMPLEWLGYEADYLNPSVDALPERVSDEYAAVILDFDLNLPIMREPEITTWLIDQHRHGKRLVFCGSPHFSDSAMRQVFEALGVQGNGDAVRPVTQLRVAHQDPKANFENKTPVSPVSFLDLRSPAGSRVFTAVEGTDHTGKKVRFDAVFTSPWGGMMLAPYVFFRRSDYEHMWLFDPFEFLRTALATPEWPVPDTTTKAGRRIFYSHIDGDGFRNDSRAVIGKKSGEVILEDIIKKYPYPFTCSVIEAEIRALAKDQDPKEEPLLVKLSREMFALPNVEAGSHSYTHPFYWQENDKTSALYTEDNLELKPEIDVSKINLEREITGSIKYIESTLLPPGKKVEIFLWSGNCRPGEEALAICDRLGIENINGGYVIITKKNPSLTKVSPRSMMWGDRLQVFCSHENDNIYRGVWTETGKEGAQKIPFFSGFMHAVDSFQRTETPLRLKPVNIYFHFYSGDNLAALRALKSLFDWAATQPLHAVTAKQFTRIVKDARRTELFQDTDGSWLISNHGESTNHRIRSGDGYPDLAASEGVLGSADAGAYRYIHSSGRPLTRLRLTATPPIHLGLESSTAPIQFTERSAKTAAFATLDFREAEVILAGAPPHITVEAEINGVRSNIASDRQGRILLHLPRAAQVRIRVL